MDTNHWEGQSHDQATTKQLIQKENCQLGQSVEGAPIFEILIPVFDYPISVSDRSTSRCNRLAVNASDIQTGLV